MSDYQTKIANGRIPAWHINNFWSKVIKTDTCWLWTGTKNKQGYGVIGIEGHQYIVTRIAYAIQNRKDPFPYCVLHKCDNILCMRNNHLFLGTRSDNNKDRANKGRNKDARGENTGTHILVETDIPVIRLRHTNGESIYSINRDYSVSYTTLFKVVHRQTWKHINP